MLSLSVLDTVTSRVGRMNIATILAIVPGLVGIFGIGHIYLGSARRGIAMLPIGIGFGLIFYSGFASSSYVDWSNMMAMTSTAMITTLALILVGLSGLVGFWIWQIFDARKIAKQTTEV